MLRWIAELDIGLIDLIEQSKFGFSIVCHGFVILVSGVLSQARRNLGI